MDRLVSVKNKLLPLLGCLFLFACAGTPKENSAPISEDSAGAKLSSNREPAESESEAAALFTKGVQFIKGERMFINPTVCGNLQNAEVQFVFSTDFRATKAIAVENGEIIDSAKKEEGNYRGLAIDSYFFPATKWSFAIDRDSMTNFRKMGRLEVFSLRWKNGSSSDEFQNVDCVQNRIRLE